VEPRVIVAIGATAARGLSGKSLAIGANRGRLMPLKGAMKGMVITVHPSYLLRLREDRDKRREFDLLVKDLRLAAQAAR
jgi:DNA polymerase